MKAGFAEAAKERAEIVKSLAEVVRSQARQLYVITATIIAAYVSIWVAPQMSLPCSSVAQGRPIPDASPSLSATSQVSTP